MDRRHHSRGLETRTTSPVVISPRCPVTGYFVTPGDGAHIVVKSERSVHSEYVLKIVAEVYRYDESVPAQTFARIDRLLAQLGWG